MLIFFSPESETLYRFRDAKNINSLIPKLGDCNETLIKAARLPL